MPVQVGAGMPELNGAQHSSTARDPERITKRLLAQLEALGHTVTLQEAAAA